MMTRRARRAQRRRWLILGALNSGYRHAYDLSRATGLRAGALYPELRRMENEGIVTASWDEGPYPRRRAYQISQETADA